MPGYFNTGLQALGNMCETGYIRSIGLIPAAVATTIAFEGGRRVFSAGARGIISGIANTIREKSSEDWDKWSQKTGDGAKIQDFTRWAWTTSRADWLYGLCTPYKEMSYPDLIKGFLGLTAFSMLWLAGTEVLLGAPHSYYNEVAKYLSPFKLSGENNIANIINGFSKLKTWGAATVASYRS